MPKELPEDQVKEEAVTETAEMAALDPFGGDLQLQIASLKERIIELETALAEKEDEESRPPTDTV